MIFQYIHWDIDPEIVNLFGISLRYYGLLFVGGLIVSLSVLKLIFEREKIPIKYIDTLSIYGMIGIFLGARIVHCVFYEANYYLSHPLEIVLPIRTGENSEIEFVGYRGLASHGGVLGIILALIFYARNTKQSIPLTLDMLAIVAPIAGIFIRLANLMNSEIIGKATELPWAFVFVQVDNVPRHPAQLYEALCYFAIFIILFSMYKLKGLKGGSFFYLGSAISLVFISRFFIEFIKENQVAFEQGWQLNMGQWLSIPFIVLGVLLVWLSKQKKLNKVY